MWFSLVLQFPASIKLTAMIITELRLKVALNIVTLALLLFFQIYPVLRGYAKARSHSKGFFQI